MVVCLSSQLGLRVNGLKVLEDASRVGRKVWIEGMLVEVVSSRDLDVVLFPAKDLGVVVLLCHVAGRRLSVKENGNKLGEGGAVAWWWWSLSTHPSSIRMIN